VDTRSWQPKRPGGERQTIAVTILLLWLAFVARGLWYCAMAPAWEGYDEPFHFAYLQHVAAGLGPPAITTPVSLEVQNSLHLLSIPWELQFQTIPQPLTTYDDYWRLPAEQRASREVAVRGLLSSSQAYQPATEPIANYEAQQAPLYYWTFAVPLRWMSGSPLLSQIFALRFLSMLLASAVVPLAYLVAREVLRDPARALGATALLVLFPELMINLARVSNESMAMICFTLVQLFALKVVAEPLYWLWWLLLGAALGCGLLTKAYFLTAVPALMVLAIYCLVKQKAAPDRPRLAVAARIGAAFALVFAIAGAFYLRVHALTGSWSGLNDDAALRSISLVHKLVAVLHVNWKSGAVSVLLSHIWFGGWSFLRLLSAFYVAGFALIVLAIAGALSRLVGWRKQEPAELRGIFVLSAFYGSFWAGLGYHVILTYLNQGVSSSAGWYLYCLVAGEVVLLVWGLQAFVPARFLFLGLCAVVALADIFGVHALLLPYYTGLTVHVAGRVPSRLAATLSNLPLVFSRLAINKPAWLASPILVGWWLSYLAATIGVVLLVASIAARQPKIDTPGYYSLNLRQRQLLSLRFNPKAGYDRSVLQSPHFPCRRSSRRNCQAPDGRN
jgi:hypothetical protein